MMCKFHNKICIYELNRQGGLLTKRELGKLPLKIKSMEIIKGIYKNIYVLIILGSYHLKLFIDNQRIYENY